MGGVIHTKLPVGGNRVQPQQTTRSIANANHKSKHFITETAMLRVLFALHLCSLSFVHSKFYPEEESLFICTGVVHMDTAMFLGSARYRECVPVPCGYAFSVCCFGS